MDSLAFGSVLLYDKQDHLSLKSEGVSEVAILNTILSLITSLLGGVLGGNLLGGILG